MTEKFRVLLILNEAPLQFSGAASRWYSILVSSLLKRNIDIEIVSSCKNINEINELKLLYPNSKFFLYDYSKKNLLQKLRTIFRPFSYTAPREMREYLSSLDFDKYDVVHVEQTFATWNLATVPPNAFVSVHYLATLDQGNTEQYGFKDFIISYLMKFTERRLLRNYRLIKSCSLEIENKIKEWYPHKKYIHFPFAIDATKYLYLADEKRVQNKNILLVASMNWLPGKSAAINLLEKIWPEVKRQNQDAKLTIVGFEARSVLNKYLNYTDVEIYENVPDVKVYFDQGDILIYTPSAGSGVKIKIQESMLNGIPIVTNRYGAEGLNLESGKQAYVENDEANIISSAHNLLNDTKLKNVMRLNARNHIELECGEEKIIEQVLNIYREIKMANKNEK